MKNIFALSVILLSCITPSHTHADTTFVHKEGRIPYIIHPKNDAHLPFSLTSILQIMYPPENCYTQDALWKKDLWINVILDGTVYKIIGWLGRGAEGIVFKILTPDDQLLALKVYNSIEYQNGDKLALEKAIESKPFMNIPLVVNSSYCYSIFPFLGRTLNSFFSEFVIKVLIKLKESLKKDGLDLNDFHEGNWMVDDHGNIIRIDLGSLVTAQNTAASDAKAV